MITAAGQCALAQFGSAKTDALINEATDQRSHTDDAASPAVFTREAVQRGAGLVGGLAAVLVYVVNKLLLKLRIVLHHLDHLVVLLRIQTFVADCGYLL